MEKDPLEDDLKLVEGCINREIIAWSQLVNKYSNLISASIKARLKKYGITVSYQDVEDIQQNILASIWEDEKLKTIKNRKDISYWIAIVSGNAAIRYMYDKRFSEAPRTISLFEKIDEKELAQLIPATQSNTINELTRTELSKKIDTAIESLPSKEKLIIKLEILHNKKYSEISDILNIPHGTVSSYIKRAKEKLRIALKDFK